MQGQELLSVSALNGRVKSVLEQDVILQDVLVEGEISNYKLYPSGHHYFSMKDAEGAVRCVMFRGSATKLSFQPESGMKVIAAGRVSVFPRDGAYQLYVNRLILHGAGDLQAAFEALKAKLMAEGLFEAQRKKKIPRFPKRIALITSGAGAAVQDMIRILAVRYPLATVLVLPVRVQGAQAPAEIAGALLYANAHKVADVIITGRGGGSMEDLWAFNDERVCRAIAASEIPVISAVGHEPDVTIADYVADLRASTPSNAAELATPDVDELREVLDSNSVRMAHALGRQLQNYRGRIFDLAQKPVLVSPRAYLTMRRDELGCMHERLAAAMGQRVAGRREEYVRLAATLDALSPLKVLSRGYGVVQKVDGASVRTVRDVAVGEALMVGLQKGRIHCRVEEIEEK